MALGHTAGTKMACYYSVLDKLAFCTHFETTNTTASQDVLPLTVAAVSKSSAFPVKCFQSAGMHV